MIIRRQDSVSTLKRRLETTFGVPANQQQITYGNQPLKDHTVLYGRKIGFCRLVILGNLPASLDVRLTIHTWSGKHLLLKLKASDTIDELKAKIQEKEGVPIDQQILTCNGVKLEDAQTLASYRITAVSKIMLDWGMKGGKPVIYLFPPKTTDVSVRLSLVPQWEFSVLYPVVPIKDNAVYWSVEATPSGNMTHKETGSSISYLFWEAE